MIRTIAAVLAILALPAAFSREPGLLAGAATTAPASRHVTSPLHGAALHARLKTAAPRVDPEVLALALQASACAIRSGAATAASRLAVIDYSRPSTEPRMWVFDLQRAELLYAEHVAHGSRSGENMAHAFSNRDGSHQSSLGLFVAADTYTGGNGYSLNLDGLEPGFNDQARARRIVIHGAPYVDARQAVRQGRLGRSHGCPAVRPSIAHPLIDTLKHGQLVFAYYPDPAWLASSRFLRCPDPQPERRTAQQDRGTSPAG